MLAYGEMDQLIKSPWVRSLLSVEFRKICLSILDYMHDIGGYAVHSSEYEGAPSPILQVFDQYKEDLIWGQDAAHYVGAMSDDGRQVVHVQAGFK